MTVSAQNLDNLVKPAGPRGVYIIAIQDFDLDMLPAVIHGRPITALAPHPRQENLLYITVEHPETLGFLPDPYIDLRQV